MTSPHTTRVTESQVQKRVHDKRETLQKNKKNYLTYTKPYLYITLYQSIDDFVHQLM